MRKLLDKFLPTERKWRRLSVIGITIFLAIILSLLGINVFRDYGMALFVLVPLFIGASPVILYGKRPETTQNFAIGLAFLSLAFFALALLCFAIEGIICIVMSIPVASVVAIIGSWIGLAIVNKQPNNAITTLLILFFVIPITAFVEKDKEPTLTSVTTTIEINADAETVWKNVIEFPQLDEPTEFLFKTGIAYPINAKINGNGVGAIRHCNFTTGSFVEPITIWNEPNLLKFSVDEQPAPMKELSFWDIDAPHLHDYFVSKQGQFKLTKLQNGNTLLEGTTWYYHNIRPEFYWRIWSNYIVHKIHERVLKHIKQNAEKNRNS